MTATTPKPYRRPIPELTTVRLWTRAGGRCEFCNDYLLQDALTRKEANFSNVAHIVAVSPNGPRGDHPLPRAERDGIDNLMLAGVSHDTKGKACYPAQDEQDSTGAPYIPPRGQPMAGSA